MARGRKSASELSTVAVIEKVQRPDPPIDLPEEAKQIWVQVISSIPAEWVRPEAFELLYDYCHIRMQARKLSRQIFEEGDQMDQMDLDRLLKMREREVRSAVTLATKLRLTTQSTVDNRKSKGTPQPRAWDVV